MPKNAANCNLKHGNDVENPLSQNAFYNEVDLKTEKVRSQTIENGGGERIRTDDPLLAKQVLYQLSYTPEKESLDCVRLV